MLILIICIALVVIGVAVVYKGYFDIGLIIASTGSLLGLIAAMLLILAHIPYLSNKKQTEMQEQRRAILYIMEKDGYTGSDIIGQISAYNAEVKRGRLKMDSFWLSAYEFKFWYDLELIELE